MKFYIDNMLNKLAKWLRFMGLDTVLIQTPVNHDKIDAGVFITTSIDHYLSWPFENKYYLNEDDLYKQLSKIFEQYKLQSKLKPFSRCSNCNTKLNKVEKEKIVNTLPPLVAKKFQVFYFCNHCKKVYWQGSHYNKIYKIFKMKEFL